MKRSLLLFALVIVIVNSYAQEIGARFGDVVGNNVAVDAIFGLGEFSRIHADVSFGNNLGAEALWDFLYRPVNGQENLHWYVGVGPSVLFSNPFFLGASGEIGLEFHFDFPLAIGADWRPTFWIIDTTDFRTDSFGINARYVFGK